MRRCGMLLLLLVAGLHIPKFTFAECPDADGECVDCESWCPAAVSICRFVDISIVCPVTCDSCLNEECRDLECEQRCIPPANETETAQCDCLAGYELDDDGVSCNDIDECETDDDICDDGDNTTSPVCVNTAGDYVCSYCEDYDSDDVFSYYGERRGCCYLDDVTTCGKSSTNRGSSEDDDDSDDRIFGGEDAVIQRWPWQVYAGLANGTGICGGSLIHPDWVVTAAYCLDFINLQTDSFHVVLGVTDLFDINSQHLQNRRVDAFIQHEGWNRSTLENDIGLMHLETPATFNEFVSPICLPGGEIPPVGETCYVTGYGQGNLQQADQQIISDEACTLFLEYLNFTIFYPETQICAGVDDDGRGPCFGDTGGPLMCQRCDTCDWYLAGIVSFGISCGRSGFHEGYTKVTAFEEWILDHIFNDVSYEPEQCTRPTWDLWGQWSECTDPSCANQVRTRSCLNGTRGQPDCLGNSRQVKSCNLTECKGSWSDWEDRAGAECSEPCGGGGEVEQVRFCIDGILCDGPSVRFVSCNEEACTGAWSTWSSWSDCTATCEGGDQIRTRVCLEVPANCTGSNTDAGVCNTGSCGCGSLTNEVGDSLCCDTYLVAGAKTLCTLTNFPYYRDNCAAACCRLTESPPLSCS